MIATAGLRLKLSERRIPYSTVGTRGTRWEANGVGWVAMEGSDGGLWLRTAGTVSDSEAIEITLGGGSSEGDHTEVS